MIQLDERTIAYAIHDVDVLETLYKMEEKKRMDMNMKKEVDEKVNEVFAPFLRELDAAIANSLSKDHSPENLNRLIKLLVLSNQVKDDMTLRLYAKKHFNEILTRNVDAGAKKNRELEKENQKLKQILKQKTE